jgi:hypothetical protein
MRRQRSAFFATTKKGFVYKFGCRAEPVDAQQIFISNPALAKSDAADWEAETPRGEAAVRLIQAMANNQTRARICYPARSRPAVARWRSRSPAYCRISRQRPARQSHSAHEQKRRRAEYHRKRHLRRATASRSALPPPPSKPAPAPRPIWSAPMRRHSND